MNLLNRDELKRKGITYSNVHLIRLESAGKFPKRVRFSACRVAWVETEIDDYLRACVADRAPARVAA